jgi:DNA integrity scanning protein DisA with diadenylate cyclase activity
MKLNKTYFILTILLFITEVLIGKYMHDNVIRPFGGDFLVVILLYCFVKAFVNTPVLPTAFGVLLFAYVTEVSQYFQLVKLLGLQHSKIAALLLGTSFSWMDLLCYTLGIALVTGIEKKRPTNYSSIKSALNSWNIL